MGMCNLWFRSHHLYNNILRPFYVTNNKIPSYSRPLPPLASAKTPHRMRTCAAIKIYYSDSSYILSHISQQRPKCRISVTFHPFVKIVAKISQPVQVKICFITTPSCSTTTPSASRPPLRTAKGILTLDYPALRAPLRATKGILTLDYPALRAPLRTAKGIFYSLESEAPVVTIFGKAWLLHVHEVLRVAPEQNKTDDVLMAHEPSTDAKKKNAQHVDAKKTTMNAPRRKRKSQQQKKKQTIWQKLVG